MASGGQSFELDCITKTFNPLNIIIKWSVKSPPIVFDISDILDPRIIKFAISSNKWKAMLQQKRVEISEKNVSDGSLEVTVTKHFEREEDVRNYIVSSLLDFLKDIVCFSMDKKKYNLETIRLEANKKRNSLASDGWTFFDGENEVCFVGEVKDIERLKEDLLVGIYLPKMYKWPVLNELGINQYLNGKSNVIVAGNDVVVRGLLYDAEKALKETEHFYKRICKRPVKFRPEDKLDLLFLADGEENEHLVNLLRKSLKEQHVKVCLETDVDNGLVYVSYFEEQEFKKAEDIINGCISYHEFSATLYEEMRKLLKRYQETKQWIVSKDGDKKFKLVCLKEVPDQEIIEQVCYVETISIPDVVCEFLSLHGKDDLEAAALSNKVTATVNKENSVLCIRGTNENKKKFKKQFKDSRCIDSFFLEVHSSFVRKHEGELKRIANARKCCLQANFPKHNAVLHETYKMVATWSHVRSCPNVSLVVGQIEDMQTDYKVVFVTDKLCPLHKCSSDQYSKHPAYMANGGMAETNPGDVVDYYIGREEDKSLTKAIVITKANANVGKDSLDSKKLGQAIDKVLQEAKTKKAGSLAIQISLLYEHLSIKDMVEVCLSIILVMCVKLEVYLVCHQTEDIYRSAKIVDDYYQKTGTGFYRQSHMKDIPFKKNFHHIKTEVKIDSIVDMKVDVIVNTVDNKLKFDKGNLSKIILSRAGSQGILEECKRNYPSGIAFGDIAITGAGNLCNSVKHIFHCALPAFNKSTFVNDVKEMVKKCFLEMDMRKVKTVAFPAFGTGTLGYPKRETAKAMFDAVEEYKYGCINSSLKRVVFVLYQGDKDSCNVFCDEEKRRKQGNTEKIDEKDFPGLHTVVGKEESQVKVTVALDEDLKHLPSNVVLTEFKFQKDGGECEMIYSSTSSSYRNDILKIFTVDRRDNTALSDSMGRLLDYCSEYKIAEVMIPTNNGIMLTTEKQIDVIVKRVQDYVKKKATERLCQVYIGIPSSESLDKIEKQYLKSGPEAFISSIKEKFFSSTLKWSRNTNQANSVEIKVIGLNDELVTQAQNELMEYAKRLPNQEEQPVANKEKKKIVKDPKANYGIHGDKIFTDETDSITAEINPGIVSYLNGQNKLDLWMNKIMKLYDIKAQNNQGVVEVCGSFSKILDFEKYLEKGDFLQNEISNDRQENTVNDLEHSEEDEFQDKGKCVNISEVQDKKHGQAKYLHKMQNEDMGKAQDHEQGNAQNEGEGNIQNKGQEKYLGKTKEDEGQIKGRDRGPDMVQYPSKMQAGEKDKRHTDLGKLQSNGREEEQLGQTLDDSRDEKNCEQHEELEKEQYLSHCNGQDGDQVKMKNKMQERKLCQTLDEGQHEGNGKMQNTGKEEGQLNDQEVGQNKIQDKIQALGEIQDKGQNEGLGEMQYEKQRKGQEEEQGKGQGEEESKGTVEEEDAGPGKGENEWHTKKHDEEQGRDEKKDNGREKEQGKRRDEDKSKKLGKWQSEEQSKVQDAEQGKEQYEKQGKEQDEEHGKGQVAKQGKEQVEEHGQWQGEEHGQGQGEKEGKVQDEGQDKVLSKELDKGQVKEQCKVPGENESKRQDEGQDEQQDQGKAEELGEEQIEEQCRVQGKKEGKSEGQGEELANGRDEDKGRELGEKNCKGQGEDVDKRQLVDSKASHQPAAEQYDLDEGIETYFDNKAIFSDEQDEEQGRNQNEEQCRDQDEEEVNGQDEEQGEGQCGKHGKEQGEERLKGQVEKQGKGQDEKQGQWQGECHGIKLDESQIMKLDEKEDKWQNQDRAKLPESLTEDKLQDNRPFGMLNDGQYQREEKDQWNVPDKSKETLYHIVTSDQLVTEQYDEAEENKIHFDNKIIFTFTRIDIELTEESLEELKVDCIVLLANENLETESLNNILRSAGPNYEEDCKKCVTTFGKMISFDCRITHGGSLPCNKILHVLKPSSNEDDLDMSLQVIHDTIEYCLNVADTEKFSTVAIPLVYTGKKTFSKLEAQEHFKAFKSFAKYAKHVRKVCISEKDMTRQNMLMKTYIDIEKEDIETTLTTNYCCNIGTVNISCVIGKLHENQVDALISMEDENFTGTSEIARALLQLGDENYKEAHASLRKEHSKGSVGSVYETKVNGGDLRCKYVFHTIIPRRNKNYARRSPIFVKDIIQTVVNILQKATTLHCKSIAMPLMGYSDELGIPTPLKICCKSMIKGIDGFLQNNSTDVKRIDIIVASSDETENMQIAMQEIIQPKEVFV